MWLRHSPEVQEIVLLGDAAPVLLAITDELDIALVRAEGATRNWRAYERLDLARFIWWS
jgi:hypothetical protein